MGSKYPGGKDQNPPSKKINYTITSLGRWSVANEQLPPVDTIKAVHVYDFDNTLFKTPLPNPKLWNPTTVGMLGSSDAFTPGGWWHNTRFLSAVGEGVDKEEANSWDGWWNQSVVELVKLSMEQTDALVVLLTGRAEATFASLIKRMVKSKGLRFDMIGLKPTVGPTNERFTSTMNFKQHFLTATLETYHLASEITIYEDRPNHVKHFQSFLETYSANVMSPRKPLHPHVAHVREMSTRLDPVVEVAEVQQLINHHNDQVAKSPPGAARKSRLLLKKTVFFTGYMINPADSRKLLVLASLPDIPEADLEMLADCIRISPESCPKPVLDKVGGMGAKMIWEVVGTACHDGNTWAASLRPISSHVAYHTENATPLVVLARRKGSRRSDAAKIQNWELLPPEKRFRLETTVSEKVLLRVESDGSGDAAFNSSRSRRDGKRKHGTEDEHPRPHHQPPFANRGGGPGVRGGRGGFRGGVQTNRGGFKPQARGGGGRGGRGRGGGGHYGYRSLDDVEPKGAHAHAGQYGFPAAVYDDEPPQPQRPMGGIMQQQQQQQKTSEEPTSFSMGNYPQQHYGGSGWQQNYAPSTGTGGQGRGSAGGGGTNNFYGGGGNGVTGMPY